MAIAQWAETEGGFVPCGGTVTALKAGFYRPFISGGMMPQLVISPLNLVTDDLIVLADFPVEHVVKSVKTFWESAALYKKHGMIHKRSFLLEGPPGTGKTSISNLIGKFFVENDAVVFFGGADNIASGAMAASIQQFRRVQTNPLLVVIEEFDQVMKRPEWKDAMMQLMDGANQIDNVVYLLSTNHLEAIDQRFTKRPSRVDEIIHVGQPSETARREFLRLLLDKYDGEREDLALWTKATEGLLISHLKEAVLAVKIFGQPLEATIERLRTMVPEKNDKKDKNKWAVAEAIENLSQFAFAAANAADEED